MEPDLGNGEAGGSRNGILSAVTPISEIKEKITGSQIWAMGRLVAPATP